MNQQDKKQKQGKPAWRKWLHRIFFLWFIVSTTWLINSYRTQNVDPKLLQSSESVSVNDSTETLQFLPTSQPNLQKSNVGLIFICGAGVSSDAYAPLLHPIAESGYQVHIVKLPYRLAPLESHKQEAIKRVRSVINKNTDVESWVVSGHSLGAALACRAVHESPNLCTALVLIATTHPRDFSLAKVNLPVTKIYGTVDGVAPMDKVKANANLLPEDTRWVELPGANHSQFAHYGNQLFDGTATISREAQQDQTRVEILKVLQEIATGNLQDMADKN